MSYEILDLTSHRTIASFTDFADVQGFFASALRFPALYQAISLQIRSDGSAVRLVQGDALNRFLITDSEPRQPVH